LSYQTSLRFGERKFNALFFTLAGVKAWLPEFLHPYVVVDRRPGERLLDCRLDKKLKARWRFDHLLGHTIAEGIRRGLLSKWPKTIIAAAHWTRADLSAMADFPKIKSKFDAIHKSYASLIGPYHASVNIGKHKREFDVWLVDTQELVPATQKGLAALGKMHGFEKLDPGVAPDGTGYVQHMDRLLRDDPLHFQDYAVKDAEICALHTEWMVDFARNDLGLNISRPPATLGSLSVKYLELVWRNEGIGHGVVNGFESVSQKVYVPTTRKYVTKRVKQFSPCYALYEELAKMCFHGGRNECFHFGPTEQSDWHEFDLSSAYATSLATLQIPDYDAARHTTDPGDFHVDQLGFAWLAFEFPQITRFPCLPVVAPNDRGLVYPLRGETYATAPEIALARRLGASITIKSGVVIPWSKDSPQPFQIVIRDLLKRRAQYPKVTIENEMFKQLGNSLYGKLGQGLKDQKGFNTRECHREPIKPCPISNPFLAAHVTGLIRATVGELIAGIPDERSVISVTTDGFVTDARLDEIDATGPVCKYLSAAREELTGDGAILEPKFEVSQLLPWTTRGIATLAGEKPKVARGGMKVPNGEDPNIWLIKTMIDRTPETKWASSDPKPFRRSYETNADHVFVMTERKVSFEFDYKRSLVDPVRRYVGLKEGEDYRLVQHIACETVPWGSIEEFNETARLVRVMAAQVGRSVAHDGGLGSLGGVSSRHGGIQGWRSSRSWRGRDASQACVHPRLCSARVGVAGRIISTRRRCAHRGWLPNQGAGLQERAAAQGTAARTHHPGRRRWRRGVRRGSIPHLARFRQRAAAPTCGVDPRSRRFWHHQAIENMGRFQKGE
jgi:hypothetical protein